MLYIAGLLAALSGLAVGRVGHEWVWLLAISSLVAVLSCLHSRYRSYGIVVAIFSLIALRTVQVLPPPTFQPQLLSDQSVTVIGRVAAEPEEKAYSVSVTLDQVVISSNSQPWYGQMIISTPLFTEVEYGDVIEARGSLSVTDPNEDSYHSYLYNHQIYATMQHPQITVQSHRPENLVIESIIALRHLCQEAVIHTLPRDEAGLLLGITLGLDQPLSEKFTQALRNTSTTHIIVASGYNASIIIATIFSLTGRFGRRISFVLALMLLVAYVTFSGGNPSMIRAAVMASIAAVGQLAGRQRLARHILFISATAMLIVNPLWLLDTSFQLSVAATAGIIEIEPLISTMLHKLPRIIRETTSTTLAAQLATLPIIAATFGQISVFGSIANLLILWTVPWVMLTGIIYIPITLAAPGVSWLLIWAVEPALWYIKHIVEIAANLPLAAANIHITFLFAALYYLALLLIKGSVSHVSVSTIKN